MARDAIRPAAAVGDPPVVALLPRGAGPAQAPEVVVAQADALLYRRALVHEPGRRASPLPAVNTRRTPEPFARMTYSEMFVNVP